MGYSKESYIKVNAMLSERKARAEAEAESRTKELYKKLPELRCADTELRSAEMKIIDAIRAGRDGIEERMKSLEAENLALQAKRRAILTAAGYPADYTEPRYECSACRDTGYVGRNMCACKRRALVMAGYDSSGIGALMQRQSFESFSLDYYNTDAATAAQMKNNYNVIKSFAENFRGSEDGNLLLIGGTGLGKTHLSTSAARLVIERGFDVKYETAQNIIADFENRQFRSGYGERDAEDKTERYFECDLLIIDDLGTEMTNQFTVSCLYNLINTRINRGLSMMINTNLQAAELRSRYADRITSRLFGEFAILLFAGGDIRAAKLLQASGRTNRHD